MTHGPPRTNAARDALKRLAPGEVSELLARWESDDGSEWNGDMILGYLRGFYPAQAKALRKAFAKAGAREPDA